MVILLIVLSASAGLVPVGCDSIRLPWGQVWQADKPDESKQADEFYLQPLPVQQKQAYSETTTGRFISLADFEDSPILGRGFDQLKHFSVSPAGGERKFVVNITRTGSGAMEAVLPPKSTLVYHLPGVHDFSDYTLLMLAVYSRGIRDDLTIRISTDRAGWESLPVLLREGWNNVLIDLARLKAMKDFKARGVRSIRLGFSDSTEPVRINIDDIMLIDNRREIHPVLEGAQHPSREMRLVKNGLDYVLHLPNRRPIRINQCDDGLWRLGADQAAMELAQGALTGKGGEDLSAMGRRRVGEVEILEHNSVRLRLANTWYFPVEAGEWLSLSVRRIRWEYTFYPDGRWITDVMLNNAGGEVISAVKITVPAPAIFADGDVGRIKQVERFGGLAGRWCFLIVPETANNTNKKTYEANFVRPGRLEVRIGQRDDAAGDADGDGFDQSSGCYRLLAKAGHCRFKLIPPDGGLADAVIHVAGFPSGQAERRDSTVSVNSEGLALRETTRLEDGSVLFVLPGLVDKPRWVEVAGAVPIGGQIP